MIRSRLGGYSFALRLGTEPKTLLLLHGTGGTEDDLLAFGDQLDPTATLLSPRGNVLERGMINRFFARRTPTDIDVDDMKLRAEQLARFVAEIHADHQLEENTVTAIGFSNGANIALAMMLEGQGVLTNAALLRPVIYAPSAPDLRLDDSHVLILSGEHDPFSSPQNRDQMESALGMAGATITSEVDSDAGHNLTQHDLQSVARWYAQLP